MIGVANLKRGGGWQKGRILDSIILYPEKLSVYDSYVTQWAAMTDKHVYLLKL